MKRSAPHLRLGRLGERLAARYLESEGMEILHTDLHLGHAQIDLVARDGLTFVFVEVKTLRARKDIEVNPILQLHDDQKDRILNASYEFRREYHAECFPFRCDFVEVVMGRFFPVSIKRHENWFSHRSFRKRDSVPFELKPQK